METPSPSQPRVRAHSCPLLVPAEEPTHQTITKTPGRTPRHQPVPALSQDPVTLSDWNFLPPVSLLLSHWPLLWEPRLLRASGPGR